MRGVVAHKTPRGGETKVQSLHMGPVRGIMQMWPYDFAGESAACTCGTGASNEHRGV
jgi:hypothetical protein